MAIRHEIKSQLAKLLATEDLIVEHCHVETAQFNVHTRVLTLPSWDRASNSVFDLLVGHEVGHALFTPDEDWLKRKKLPQQFVNITEDARVEKLMKRKYAGLHKTFYRGYEELSEEDFFCLEDVDVDKMNLADRANLYFKIGRFIDITFTDEETEILRTISAAETFDDALNAAEDLYKYCKKELKKDKVDDVKMPQGNSQVEKQDMPVSGSDGGQDTEEEIETERDTELPGTVEEPEVNTVDALEESLQSLINEHSSDNVYVEVPQVDLEKIIAPNSEIHECVGEHFNKIDKEFTRTVDLAYTEFKRSAQKEVNYLVKEFECKKAADSYARAMTSRTGVLDCSKLHTYKYNEDLFKKVTTLADGKDHGLVFVLDWSGSMSQVLLDTMKQLYNLMWFCKKVGIPFEVYAFTNEWKRSFYDERRGRYVYPDNDFAYEIQEGLLAVDKNFSMMNIFTSTTSKQELDEQMLNMFRVASYYSSMYTCMFTIPERIGLSGTPLNEAFVSLHQILPKFKKENKLQKVHCVVLTDGEANQLARHARIPSAMDLDSEEYMGFRRLNPDTTFLRDRKTGNTYKIPYRWNHFTDTMLANLKDRFPQVSFIGIRILAPRDAHGFVKQYHDYGDKSYESIMNDWRKNRTFAITASGYHAYFGLSSNALHQDSEFDVEQGATKAKIKSAFAKSLKTKKLNKKVLGEFISLVA